MSLAFLNPFRFFARRRLERALEAYQQSPGIDETLEVVRLLLKSGDLSTAFQYADNGYQRFSDSNELLELRQQTLKEMSREECRQLMRKIASSPRPETIAKVIEIRRSLGEFSACEKLSRRWKDRFPGSWILQFSIGKYLFQRSLIEKDKKISDRCLQQLEIAAKLNPDGYKSLLYLATLLFQLGSRNRALEVVEKLLKKHPKDPKARALWECIRNAPEEVEVDQRLDALERASSDRPLDPEFLAELEEIESQTGVYGMIVQQKRGNSVSLAHSYFAPDSPFEFNDADSALSDLVHSLRVSSNRMGIGELKTCILEGTTWQVFFRNHSYRSLLLCTSHEFSEDDFEKAASRVAPEGVMT